METSWGFDRLAGWWIYIITIIIFLPWEIFARLWHTKAYSNIKNKLKVHKQTLLHIKSEVSSALTKKEFLKRLRNASLVLLIFMIFAEEFVVQEFSTIPRIKNIWHNASISLNSAFDFFNYYSIFNAIRPSYELRGFIFYIVGLVILRQGTRYIFSIWVKKIEDIVLEKIDDIYSQPNKNKLISYSLLTLIALVFISYFLGQGSYSLKIASPLEENKTPDYPTTIIYPFEKEEVIFAELLINDFDVITSKLTGTLTLSEAKHIYKEGGCYYEDYFTEICKDPIGFPSVFYNEKIIIVNGKELQVTLDDDIAIVVDSNFSDQASGNNYFFPFNEYVSKITVSSDNFWDYAAINISTSHRFFSIHQEPYQNRVFTHGSYSYFFRISYAPYYQILVVVIFFALFSFLWVIWQTKERETLIELSLGVFATIITTRGFLIPQEFSSEPVFLDQILLVYIALFLFILLYKHEAIKEQKSA